MFDYDAFRRAIPDVAVDANDGPAEEKKKPNRKRKPTIKVTEKWKARAVENMLEFLPPDHRDNAVLRRIVSSSDRIGRGDDARYESVVTLRYATKWNAGRMYGGAAQPMSKRVRQSCIKATHDVDIVNCHPTLLRGVCDEFKIPCPVLTHYVLNRDRVFSDLAAAGVARVDAKRMVLVVMFGGAPSPKLGVFGADLAAELAEITERLLVELPDGEEMKARAIKRKGGAARWMGSFRSELCQIQEEKVMTIARRFLADQGEIVADIFDGLMLNAPYRDVIDTTELEAEITRQLDVELRFEVVDVRAAVVLPPVELRPLVPHVPIPTQDVIMVLPAIVLQDAPEEDVANFLETRPRVHLVVWHTGDEPSPIHPQWAPFVRGDVLRKHCYPGTARTVQGVTTRPVLIHSRSAFPHHEDVRILATSRSLVPPQPDDGSRPHSCYVYVDMRDKTLSSAFVELCSNTNLPFGADPDEVEELEYVRQSNGKRVLHPIELSTRFTGIRASMGSGKSFATNVLVGKRDEKGDYLYPRVLIISGRRSQAQTSMRAFASNGFVHYADHEGDLAGFPRIVCQYESMFRLENCEPFDLVIIDEIKAVLQQVPSRKTNRHNLYCNWRILEGHLRHPQAKVLFLDAHIEIDDQVAKFARKLFPRAAQRHFLRYRGPPAVPRRYMFIRATGVEPPPSADSPMTNNDTEIGEDAAQITTAANYEEDLSADAALALRQLKEYLARDDRKPVIVGCRTIRFLNVLRSHLGVTKETGWVLSSSTPDAEMAAFMRDPDAALQSRPLVLMTSSVTVGVDIQVEVGRVFLFMHDGSGCAARDAHQMAVRARRVVRDTVYVVLPTPHGSAPVSVEHHIQRLCEANKVRNAYVDERLRGMVGDAEFVPGARQKWRAGVMSAALAYKEHETRECFAKAFVRLCDRTGALYCDAPGKPTPNEVALSRVMRDAAAYHEKQMRAKALAAAFHEMLALTIGEIQSRLAGDQAESTHQRPTVDQRAFRDVYRALENLPRVHWDGVLVSDLPVMCMPSRRRAMERALSNDMPTVESLSQTDKDSVAKAGDELIANDVPLPSGALDFACQAVEACGWSSIRDNDSEVVLSELGGEAIAEIEAMIDKGLALASKFTKTQASKNPALRLQRKLTALLLPFGRRVATMSRKRKRGARLSAMRLEDAPIAGKKIAVPAAIFSGTHEHPVHTPVLDLFRTASAALCDCEDRAKCDEAREKLPPNGSLPHIDRFPHLAHLDAAWVEAPLGVNALVARVRAAQTVPMDVDVTEESMPPPPPDGLVSAGDSYVPGSQQ